MNRHLPRTIALALGLTLAGAVPATASPQAAAAPSACLVTAPQINNSRFCAKVTTSHPSQWLSLGSLSSRDGRKYKLDFKDGCNLYWALVPWTSYVQVGNKWTDCRPTRATVTGSDGTTWSWNI